MTEKHEKLPNFEHFLAQNPDFLERFQAPEDAKNLTQPSVILKTGISDLGVRRIPPKEIEQYLLMHPVVPRGIEIKANRMTGRGFKIMPSDDSAQAKSAVERMEKLISDSGGENIVNSLIKDTYAFGNGYLTLLSDDSDEIVYLSKEHPIYFRIARNTKDKKEQGITPYNIKSDFAEPYGTMKIDVISKKPESYTQVIFDESGEKVTPIGSEIPNERVVHLVFDTWGDEAEGISLIQYIHLVLKYLMNIEEAGAEAIYRSGFTQKKITTEIMNEKDLKKMARNLKQINSADSIILPKGTDMENLQPGTTEFDKVHDIFLTLVAIRLGIPKPILTLDGTSTNKATLRELMRDLIYDIHADELKVKHAIEQQIFVPACKSIFGDNFDKFPKFVFNDFDEGKDEKASILKTTAEYVSSLIDSYKKLLDFGLEDQAKKVLQLAMMNLPVKDLISEPETSKEELIPSVKPKEMDEPEEKDKPIEDDSEDKTPEKSDEVAKKQ